jgi:hypothetical protein
MLTGVSTDNDIGTQTAARVLEILAAVKRLAVEYYRLTGRPLGVTGGGRI